MAGEAGVPVFSLSGSDFIEMFVGVGAARVRDLFVQAQAQAKAPSIVFIDELDALGKARGLSPVMGGHDEREQTLNQLLGELDGFDSGKGVIIMAATNRPEILDPALLRPGRFDRKVIIDRPDLRGREMILRVHVRGVRRISIIPHGVAALGFTQQEPTEDHYLMTRTELLDRLDVLLGGRVAEEIVFGDVSTGAQDDLRKATKMAHHMVAQCSMSETLGLAAYEQPTPTFLDVPRPDVREYSEETARTIDEEVVRLLEAAHVRVRDTLTTRRSILESLGKMLIEREVVDAEMVRGLLRDASKLPR